MTKKLFTANRFTATQHSTADEKARFCVAFAAFILSGFPRHRFKTAFYRRLSNIFGHIAHFDETGFWEIWFATPAKQCQFIRRIHEQVPMGDPHFCWSDVERELKLWILANAEAIDAVLTEIERKCAEAIKAETDRRAALQSKTHQRFTVVAKSTNLGGFGHRQYITCAGRQRVESPSHLPLPLAGGAGRQRAVDPRRTRLVQHPGGRMPGTNPELPPARGGVTWTICRRAMSNGSVMSDFHDTSFVIAGGSIGLATAGQARLPLPSCSTGNSTPWKPATAIVWAATRRTLSPCRSCLLSMPAAGRRKNSRAI